MSWPEWRNWLTRWTQNPLSFGTCGFESRLGHHLIITSLSKVAAGTDIVGRLTDGHRIADVNTQAIDLRPMAWTLDRYLTRALIFAQLTN